MCSLNQSALAVRPARAMAKIPHVSIVREDFPDFSIFFFIVTRATELVSLFH